MAESAIHARLAEIYTQYESETDPYAPEKVADRIMAEFDVLYKAEWVSEPAPPGPNVGTFTYPEAWRNQ